MPTMKRLFWMFAAFVFLLSGISTAAGENPATVSSDMSLISSDVLEPPALITKMISIAEKEWETLKGRGLPRSNKYTKWVNSGSWGWCAGFTSWCAIKAGIPHATLNEVLKNSKGKNEPVFVCSAVSPAKQLRSNQHIGRTTMIPQKGFFMVYGERSYPTVHIGLVCDVERLSNGKYRLTTIEGNMRAKEGNTKTTLVKYIADYEPVDVYHRQNQKTVTSNLTQVPPDERSIEETSSFSYRLRVSDTDRSDWYVTCFIMTWIPETDYTVNDK